MLGSTGVSLTQVTDLVTTAIAGIPSALTFVNGGATQTVAQLMTNFPPSVSNSGMYARVSDLYNNGVAGQGIDDLLRCRQDSTNGQYRWVPQRDLYNGPSSVNTGSVTLIPLVTPPTLRLVGTLLGNVSIAPSPTNAYVGQKFNVVQNSTLGLFTTTITGLLGSNIALLGNTTQVLEYFATGWGKASG